MITDHRHHSSEHFLKRGRTISHLSSILTQVKPMLGSINCNKASIAALLFQPLQKQSVNHQSVSLWKTNKLLVCSKLAYYSIQRGSPMYIHLFIHTHTKRKHGSGPLHFFPVTWCNIIIQERNSIYSYQRFHLEAYFFLLCSSQFLVPKTKCILKTPCHCQGLCIE